MKNKEAKSIFSPLENYSSMPPAELWDAIEVQLDKPKKKKRAIVWWSIAASLLIGFSVPTVFYFNSSGGSNLELNRGGNENGVAFQNNSEAKNNDVQKDKAVQIKSAILNAEEPKNDDFNSNSVAVTAVSNGSFNKKDTSNDKNLHPIGSNPIIKKGTGSNTMASNRSSISVLAKSETKVQKTVPTGNSKSLMLDEKNTVSHVYMSNAIAENTVSKSELELDKTTQTKQSNTNEKSLVNNPNSSVSGFNNSTEIVENKVSNDSLGKIKSEVAQLEKSLAQLEKDKIDKKEVSKNSDRWSVQVFAGVMSSQNYNNETALDGTVDSKQSSGYGLKTNYKLNKKWGVSTGFKINQLGQKIAGVSYYNKQNMYNGMSGSLPINNNIYTSDESSNYQLVSISKDENYLFSANSRASSGLEKGEVTQNLKYFEMPLEVSYSLLNKKKTNISMNTGGFVGKLLSNDIALNGSSIGENKNVNEFVYGTLLSSTLQYEFLQKTYFFIEPGMNYYINPLENQSFNQFQWMFNVGVNVNF